MWELCFQDLSTNPLWLVGTETDLKFLKGCKHTHRHHSVILKVLPIFWLLRSYPGNYSLLAIVFHCKLFRLQFLSFILQR